jgi:hypothetical protein
MFDKYTDRLSDTQNDFFSFLQIIKIKLPSHRNMLSLFEKSCYEFFLRKINKQAGAELCQAQIKLRLTNNLARCLVIKLSGRQRIFVLMEQMFGYASKLFYISLNLSLQLCLTWPLRLCFKFGEVWINNCWEINFHGWGISGRLSGGSAAAYLQISGRLSADQRPLIWII